MTAIGIKSLRQLGFRQVGLYAWYNALLKTGYYTRLQPPAAGYATPSTLAGLWSSTPENAQLQALLGPHAASLIAEADEIVAGQARLFGANPRSLQLAIHGPLKHWTYYETGSSAPAGPEVLNEEAGASADIKYLWEPARFGWACTLGRAYRLTGDETYARAFWQHTETFLDANPAYLGPNWASAQEVALRLMALVWAYLVFANSPQTTPERRDCLVQAVAESAARIPPTLAYSRAQGNNHLLSEAAGLYTASLFLPNHPMAKRWRKLGWRWFNQGIQHQFDNDGAYIQHSANYHRLALQLGLWVNCLAEAHGHSLPAQTRQRLAAGTRWLLAISDPHTGRLPNLGPNDGAYIFSLAACPFHDFRPVLQAAAAAFLGDRPFANGLWDEMRMWFNTGQPESGIGPALANSTGTPHLLRHPRLDSWAYLRMARFHSRPGHADQLHLDLWWSGLNIALDAGTYLYNAPPPWDNALTHAAVHNTLTVNGLDQMLRVGRFLYLDWAQAQVIGGEPTSDRSWQRLVGCHDGYRRLGVIHQRSIASEPGGWLVEDAILPSPQASRPNSQFLIRLHWLLPDWPWELDGPHLILTSPAGQVSLQVTTGNPPSTPITITIARCGELIAGPGPVKPTWGWTSPTYGAKVPALSAGFTLSGHLPLTMTTNWILIEERRNAVGDAFRAEFRGELRDELRGSPTG